MYRGVSSSFLLPSSGFILQVGGYRLHGQVQLFAGNLLALAACG